MLRRLARTAAIAAAVVVAVVIAAALLDPSLTVRAQRWSLSYSAAVLGGAWLAALVGLELARARSTSSRRGRSLTLPPLRRR
jgi:O-antigen ligase